MAESIDAPLSEAVGGALVGRVVALVPVPGGDINRAWRATLDDGRAVFVKSHEAPPEGFFDAEADGLARLSATGTVRVPRVLAVSDRDPAFLVLEWIEPGPPAADHDERLGRELAALHRWPTGEDTFGLDRPNFVGAVPQANDPLQTWPEFLATRRLEPLTEMALDRGALPASVLPLLDRVVDRLVELVGPPEPPSSLHGDLWGGNAITDSSGSPVLIDPAVFRGHREIDLAMMRLFGGFSPRVLDAYQEVAPLADGHADRVRLYQLVPLLVHAVLFGAGYGAAVLDTLAHYA